MDERTVYMVTIKWTDIEKDCCMNRQMEERTDLSIDGCVINVQKNRMDE